MNTSLKMKQVLLTVVELGLSQKRDIIYGYTYLEYIYCHICNHDCPYACSKPCFNRGGFYQWLLNSLKVRATPALMSEMRKKLFIFVASLQGAQWTACNLPHLHLATFTRKVATWRFEVKKLFNLGEWNLHLLGFNLPSTQCTSIIQRCIQRAHKWYNHLHFT